MKVLQPIEVGKVSSLKNSNWKIELSDTSFASEFSFAEYISDKYVTTNIKSPLGESRVVYNTVSDYTEEGTIIDLNFEDIDQTRVGVLSFKSESGFFGTWKVELRDNRNGSKVEIRENTDVLIEPVIEFNKLMGYGFMKESESKKSPLELHLTHL